MANRRQKKKKEKIVVPSQEFTVEAQQEEQMQASPGSEKNSTLKNQQSATDAVADVGVVSATKNPEDKQEPSMAKAVVSVEQRKTSVEAKKYDEAQPEQNKNQPVKNGSEKAGEAPSVEKKAASGNTQPQLAHNKAWVQPPLQQAPQAKAPSPASSGVRWVPAAEAELNGALAETRSAKQGKVWVQASADAQPVAEQRMTTANGWKKAEEPATFGAQQSPASTHVAERETSSVTALPQEKASVVSSEEKKVFSITNVLKRKPRETAPVQKSVGSLAGAESATAERAERVVVQRAASKQVEEAVASASKPAADTKPQIKPTTEKKQDMAAAAKAEQVAAVLAEQEEQQTEENWGRETRPFKALAWPQVSLTEKLNESKRAKENKQLQVKVVSPEEYDEDICDEIVAKPATKRKRRRRKRSVAGIMIASLLKVLFVLACLVLIAGSIVAVQVTSYMVEATEEDESMLDLESIKLNQTSFFMSLIPGKDPEIEESWVVYQELVGPENRIWVSIDKIPDQLEDAVIAIEDREFENHRGVNISRTAYAVVNEFFPVADIAFGASTIEQQLVKNLTKDNESVGESGYKRKMREMYRAWGLSYSYSKDMIMEAYLNTISLSGTIAGVQAGAHEYFNKDVSELTLAESAMIAGITRKPGAYDPYTYPDVCLARRNSVLEQMLLTNKITQKQHDEAVQTPLGLSSGGQKGKNTGQVFSYFSDHAFEEIIGDMMEQRDMTKNEAVRDLFTGGYKIYLTVDTTVQWPMEDMYLHGYEEDGFFTQLRNNYGRLYKDVMTVQEEKKDGSIVDVLPQSASAIIDYDGALKGVVGGIGPKTESRVLNRATQSPRSVGSTMKPIAAYALGIDTGIIDYSSMIVDSGAKFISGKKASVDPETGEPSYNWPRNFSGIYRNNPMSVVSAIAESTNTVAVKVGMRVGIEEMYDFLVNTLQISSIVGEGAVSDMALGPLVLGGLTKGITAYELAGAYMMFGNGGEFNSLHSYTKMVDSTGNTVMESKRTSVQAISPETAYVMNRLLNTVVFGTPGVRATAIGFDPDDGMDSVAKTGTTDENRDRWIVGLTPYYVTAVWWGYDDNHQIKWTTGSSSVHAKVWKTLMEAAEAGKEPIEFPEKPAGVEEESFCTESGLLAGAHCPGRQKGYYTSFRVPNTCVVHDGSAPPEAPAA